MDQFPSNSFRKPENKGVPERPKIEPIITSRVILKKQPLSRKFLSTFVQGSARGAMNRAFVDNIVPAIKEMMVDGVIVLVDNLIYGETRNRSRRSYGVSNSPYTSYQSAFKGNRNTPREHRPDPRSEHIRFDDIVLPTRSECEVVLEELEKLIEQYREAKVSDLFDMLNLPSNHANLNWGWTTMDDVEIRKDGDGYRLVLPKPEPLK